MTSSLGCRLIFVAIPLCSACATTEASRVVEPQTVASAKAVYTGAKHELVIGRFENKSSYMNGLFSDGRDQIGMQARQILKTHLGDSQRFRMLDRANLDQLAEEARLSGIEQEIEGSGLLLTGAVTEFGRKETGTRALGGVLGKSKTQVAYGKVSISIVDIRTSEVLYTAQGAGEFEFTNQQVLGFGSSAGYDSTLTDKVLNLALMQAVERLVEDFDDGAWQPRS